MDREIARLIRGVESQPENKERLWQLIRAWQRCFLKELVVTEAY